MHVPPANDSSTARQDDLAFAEACDVTARFRSGEVSPVESTQAVLARIRRYNPVVNAYSALDEQRALRAAEASAQRWRLGRPLGPLDGVTLSVKDTLMVEGFPFRRGSTVTPTEPATQSAPAVDKAIRAGAIVVGITTTPEFGSGPATISQLTGITRNPWNPARTSGGSSGGAASATASGMCHLALATDAGGSVRIPSAFCGVVGMKPTGGRVAAFPASVAGAIASPGPIARSVRDVAALMAVICGPDRRDPDALPASAADQSLELDTGISGLRIAFSPKLGYASDVDLEVLDLTTRAARSFEALGAVVERADPGFQDPIDAYVTLFHSGISYALRHLSAAQQQDIGPRLRDVIADGQSISLQSYLDAQETCRALSATMAAFHETFDLLLTPTIAVPAFDAELWMPPDDKSTHGRAWTPYCYPFNLTRQPALTVPCGFTQAGLPVGLHIVGPRHADSIVLRAAFAYEALRTFEKKRPSFQS